jgi:hypothetical protein
MPMDVKQADCQPELQVVRNLEIGAADHSLSHMNAPLTHDIVGDESGLYSLHIKVQGVKYGIVHVSLTFGCSFSASDIISKGRTYASPF